MLVSKHTITSSYIWEESTNGKWNIEKVKEP